jgi:hypothetical protein
MSLSTTTLKTKNNLRSVEELDERFLNFCELKDLDASVGADALLAEVDYNSGAYRTIERYITNREKALALSILVKEDTPNIMTFTEKLNAQNAAQANEQKELEEMIHAVRHDVENVEPTTSVTTKIAPQKRQAKKSQAAKKIINNINHAKPLNEAPKTKRTIGTVIDAVTLKAKKSVQKNLPCLFVKITRSGSIQMGFAL